jgi:hypothetical protein
MKLKVRAFSAGYSALVADVSIRSKKGLVQAPRRSTGVIEITI